MKHTIETVKRDLPKVKVNVNGRIVEGRIAGRMNQFPTVWTKDNHQGWEFSWQTIVNCLNNDRALLV